MPSDPIASEKVTIERKIFFLDLKENQRGRFLKITEDVGGRRDTIMLPAPAFRDFLEALQRLVEFESKHGLLRGSAPPGIDQAHSNA
jgi:hypothetical protein